MPDRDDNNGDPSAPPTIPSIGYQHLYEPAIHSHEANFTTAPPTANLHQPIVYAPNATGIPYGIHADYAAPSLFQPHTANTPLDLGPVFDPSIERLINEDRHPRTFWGNTPQQVYFDSGPSTSMNDYITHRLHPLEPFGELTREMPQLIPGLDVSQIRLFTDPPILTYCSRICHTLNTLNTSES